MVTRLLRAKKNILYKQSKNNKVGVVIVTYNSEYYIKACLDSLSQNKRPNYSVIIIDNASQDNTIAVIQSSFQKIHIIRNKINRHFAAAVNQGIQFFIKEDYDSIVLLNPDTTVSNQMLSELKTFMNENTGVGICGPIITYADNPKKIWFAGGYLNRLLCYTRHNNMNKKLTNVAISNKKTDFISGCCMMIKTEVFSKIGYFNEEYNSYFEDVFFCERAKEAGYEILLVAQPLVKHSVSISSGNAGSNVLSYYRAYYFARNPLMYILKSMHGYRKWTSIFGQFFIRMPYYVVQSVFHREFSAVTAYFRGLTDGLLSK